MRRLILSALLCLSPMAGWTQAYPSKPINFIVQYAAGSGADQLARVVIDAAQRDNAAVNFVVRNVPGALAVIGTTALIKSPADGYTIGICSASINSSASALFKTLPYDPIRDFTFIEPLAAYTYVVAAAPELGFNSLNDLIQNATANPGKLSYVYANATAQVLSAALVKKLKIQALPVPYKAAQEGLSDISQNRVSFGVTDMGVTVPMVKSGRVKGLAVISARRSQSLPDVPSLVEQGKPAIEVMAWAGICGPKNMPPETVAWLRAQFQKARNKAEVLEKYVLLGLDPIQLGAQSFPDFAAQQLPLWTEAAKDAGIQAQ
ncbi:MAG: tripartite tricarboxylate transporter substrate binding protein [Burkholderiaceae bacterium]|nr:tripartite tricarboxylate transporter substrate binding protein [Desulfobacterales bacterium]MDP3135298.1 tripartite tricarboxylate transporter substrate binding protein [Burkholderiaceae bacterium]